MSILTQRWGLASTKERSPGFIFLGSILICLFSSCTSLRHEGQGSMQETLQRPGETTTGTRKAASPLKPGSARDKALDTMESIAPQRSAFIDASTIAQRVDPYPRFSDEGGLHILAKAAASGSGPGALVLGKALERLDAGIILKGSCYGFVSAVYEDSGFPAKKRSVVFSGKEAGPYADPAIFQAGDWLYFTHSYSATIGHSAIFVTWLDFGERVALTIDYPGNERAEPGRFRVADLYKVWGVNRPRE